MSIHRTSNPVTGLCCLVVELCSFDKRQVNGSWATRRRSGCLCLIAPFRWPCSTSIHFSFVSQVCHWCPPFSAGNIAFLFMVCHCWCPPFSVAATPCWLLLLLLAVLLPLRQAPGGLLGFALLAGTASYNTLWHMLTIVESTVIIVICSLAGTC